MNTYLIGIMFHEPESWRLWNQGIIEDYESTSGLFVKANSSEEALSWGEIVGKSLLWFVNDDPSLDWNELGYYCWIESEPESSSWSHCLSFFQTVSVGTMPDLTQMTAEAYGNWQKENLQCTSRKIKNKEGVGARILIFFKKFLLVFEKLKKDKKRQG